jgi:hypothetical protein
MCKIHRHHRWPKALPELNDAALLARIAAKLVRDGECLRWTAYQTKDGYGQVKYKGRAQYPHRLMYALCKGEVPDGMEVDHTCGFRACCNPHHLRLLSREENAGDGADRRWGRKQDDELPPF